MDDPLAMQAAADDLRLRQLGEPLPAFPENVKGVRFLTALATDDRSMHFTSTPLSLHASGSSRAVWVAIGSLQEDRGLSCDQVHEFFDVTRPPVENGSPKIDVRQVDEVAP